MSKNNTTNRLNNPSIDALDAKSIEQKLLFDKLIGHTIQDKTTKEVTAFEPLSDHILSTAKKCCGYASKFALGDIGYMIAFLHDLGKCIELWQKKLFDNTIHVDHMTAGAYFIAIVIGAYFRDSDGNCNFVGKMLAYNIISHHGGLRDVAIPRTLHSSRVGKDIQTLEDALQNGESLYNDAIKNGGEYLVGKFAEEHGALSFGNIFRTQFGKKVYADDIHHIIRLLHSCLINADCLATEAVCNPDRAKARLALSKNQASMIVLRDRLNNYLSRIKNTDSAVGIWRNAINNDCARHGNGDMGIYTLSAHTGGGKTLSFPLWGLNQAIRHDLDGIIIVTTRLGVTEQTAQLYRYIFKDINVVEHHSNIDLNTTSEERMPLETWDAPIIITTDVQFFESLRSNKNSRIRKLINISRRAIIIDEAHLLPMDWYRPIMHDLVMLTRHYQCSVMLSTATLPNFATMTDPFGNLLLSYGDKYKGVKCTPVISKETASLEPPNKVLYNFFNGIKFDTLVNRIANHQQVLCVMNTKEAAYDLYNKVAAARGTKDVFHLSTAMCGEHRSNTIDTIKKRLAAGKSVVIISTQLIEAGVDIDLPVVYRELAGLFSINQVGGRCNRERKLDHGDVYVFKFSDRYYAVPETMEDEIATMNSLYLRHKEWTKNYTFTDDDVKEFFDAYIARRKAGCTTKETKEKLFDRTYIKQWCEMANADGRSPLKGDFYFENMACYYKFIPDDQTDVIVPFNAQAKNILNKLHDGNGNLSDIRRLQRYTVSLLKSKFEKLKSKGFIKTLTDAKNEDLSDAKYIAYTLTNEADYSKEFGVAELMFNLDNKTA